MSACRSCGKPILWATTAKGKAIPLDAEPTALGNIELRSGVAHYVTPDVNAVGALRYTAHFAQCPNAKSHRKSR